MQAVPLATADISAAMIAVTQPSPPPLQSPKPFLATKTDNLLVVSYRHKGGKTKVNIGRALDQCERTKLSIFLKSEVVQSKKLGIFRQYGIANYNCFLQFSKPIKCGLIPSCKLSLIDLRNLLHQHQMWSKDKIHRKF